MATFDYSRDQMAAMINAGHSILINGVLVTRVEDLPQPASFISTPQEKSETEKELNKQIRDLTDQLAQVKLAPVETPAVETPPVETSLITGNIKR